MDGNAKNNGFRSTSSLFEKELGDVSLYSKWKSDPTRKKERAILKDWVPAGASTLYVQRWRSIHDNIQSEHGLRSMQTLAKAGIGKFIKHSNFKAKGHTVDTVDSTILAYQTLLKDKTTATTSTSAGGGRRIVNCINIQMNALLKRENPKVGKKKKKRQ